MAIFRTKTPKAIKFERNVCGVKQPDKNERVADFSYASDTLAQMIVDAWTTPSFKKRLLNKRQAKSVLAERGIYLTKPHVLTEKQYYDGHHCKDPNEVVFVLPNTPRVVLNPPKGHSLLETAKLLMAITPNGI